MSLIGNLLKEYEEFFGVKYEWYIRYSRWSKCIISQLNEGFDDFDWSDIELYPIDLPLWIQHELNTHIPSFVKDGDIEPRYIGNYMFLVKYIEIRALDYIVIAVEKI